jgi:hypothetical protein
VKKEERDLPSSYHLSLITYHSFYTFGGAAANAGAVT